MPSQIIELSSSILATLANRTDSRLGARFLEDGYRITFDDDPTQPLTVRISVGQNKKFGARSLFLHNVLVAVLKPKGSYLADCEPARMSDADILTMLDEIEDIFDSLPGLTGHVGISLKRAIGDARAACPNRIVRRRQPGSAFELGLLRKARRFELRHRDALSRLGHQFEAYRTALDEPWLEPVIARLSVQSAFADMLLIERRLSDHKRAGLLFLRERGDIFDTHRENEQNLIAIEEAVKAVQLHGDMPPIAIDDRMALRLYALVAADTYRIPGSTWRQRDGILSNDMIPWSAPMPPATAIKALMARYGEAVDRELWTGIHPLVRAGLLHLEFLKVMPLPDTNFLVARLMLSLMLHEAGLPFLPLPMMLHWDRERYLQKAQAAIRNDDPGIFLRYLVHLAGKASRRGIHMANRLRPAYAHMVKAFHLPGETEGSSQTLAEMALAHLFIADTSEVSSLYLAFARIDELGRSGICDEVILAGGRSYSHPLARELARRPRPDRLRA